MPWTSPWTGLGFAAGLCVGGLLAWGLSRWRVRRMLAKQLAAERRARSAERLAELGAMTGGLAHEIKNPLSTILLNVQLLSEGVDELGPGAGGGDGSGGGNAEGARLAEDKRRLRRRLDSLRREVERLRGILQDFLQYAGELRLDMRPADLGRAMEELTDFFAPQAQQQGVRLRTACADVGVRALADVPLLKQAVLNLLLNAVQAVSGEPDAGAGKPREVLLRTRAAGGQGRPESVVIEVIDTGPGMPEDVRVRIFEPYFTTKSGGTGLGLPTTRRLVEAMGGTIDVHTELGRGTSFTITLPALGAEGAGAEGSGGSGSAPAGSAGVRTAARA